MKQRYQMPYLSTITVILMLICLLAIALRIWRIQTDPILGIDGAGYRLIALNILDGHGFSSASSAPYTPTDFRSPLMPLFIAFNYLLFGRSDYPVMYMQVLLDVLSCLMVFDIGRNLFNAKIGILATFLVATYISSIVLTASLYSETLYFFLIVLSTWLLMGYPQVSLRRMLVVGIVLGLATLTRPLTILYPAFLAPVLFYLTPIRKQALAKLLILACGVLVTIGPWLIRNKIDLDRWSLGDSAFVYVNIALGAEQDFNWPPLLKEKFNRAAEGTLTAEERSLLPQQALDEFALRVSRIGWLGYVRIRAGQVASMWLYPAAGFLLIRDKGISLSEAWHSQNYANLVGRLACLTIWGIFPFLLTVIGLPTAFRLSKASILLIVFAVFITLPNLILQTDFRYAAPSYFLHAPIMAVGLFDFYSKLTPSVKKSAKEKNALAK